MLSMTRHVDKALGPKLAYAILCIRYSLIPFTKLRGRCPAGCGWHSVADRLLTVSGGLQRSDQNGATAICTYNI
jgi:hypothetical protein